MKVHHVNCGTMCPVSARLMNGRGDWFGAGKLVCHCLILETNDGLVLVDTGLGTADVDDPKTRLGTMFGLAARPTLLREETALAHVERLGFKREDVRHIVPTHLDLDHVGGLSDFPDAKVHVFSPELDAAKARATANERSRYRVAQVAHGPKWVRHVVDGDRWMGFERVQVLGEEVALIPLVGHTRGHCAVAVRDGAGWLLHAGDAYFFHGEIDPLSPHGLAALTLYQRLMAMDDDARVKNQGRLRDLARDHKSEVRIFSAHDPIEFDDLVDEKPPFPLA